MPAQVSELEIMEEDQIIEEVLDKFVNCHEQTYEEFLSTFTHLSKGDNVTKRGALGTNSSENILTSTQYTHANEPNNLCLRNKAIVLCTSSQFSEEEQIVLDEGQNVGSSFQGDLKRAGKVKVDNFLAMEDLAVDGEVADRVSTDWLLLPGEVEQDVIPSVPYVPSAAQPRTPEGQCRPTVKGVDGQRDEILGDEVQPFRLDPEFDYDTVTLTPKFTPEEIDAIKELSKQTQGNPDPDLEEPRG